MIEKKLGGRNMPFYFVRDDITQMKTDAIVNAANQDLKQGGGVCGAIFAAAGEKELSNACDQLSPINTGEAVITPAFQLPSQLIIHTAGPVWRGGNEREEELLRASYRNSLQLAIDNQLESIAFPLISSGIYGYPKEQALEVATSEIEKFLVNNELHVYLVIFDDKALQISEHLKKEIEHFIDQQAVHHIEKRFSRSEIHVKEAASIRLEDFPKFQLEQNSSLDQFLQQADETFSEKLFRMIDERELTDPEVYKKANLDRRLFSKIRSNSHYQPKKITVLALAIALELDIEETQELLKSAGFTLTRSTKLDLIVEYFIRENQHDIYSINEVLFHYHQPVLGSV